MTGEQVSSFPHSSSAAALPEKDHHHRDDMTNEEHERISKEGYLEQRSGGVSGSWSWFYTVILFLSKGSDEFSSDSSSSSFLSGGSSSSSSSSNTLGGTPRGTEEVSCLLRDDDYIIPQLQQKTIIVTVSELAELITPSPSITHSATPNYNTDHFHYIYRLPPANIQYTIPKPKKLFRPYFRYNSGNILLHSCYYI